MFCYKCGKSVPDGAKFCGFCGAPQKKAASAEPKIVPTAPPQPQAVPTPRYLYMDAKGLTLMNYKFDVRDAAGNLRYRAATVTEGMFTSNARIYYPNDAEALIIRQQKKMTLAAMNFDIFAPDGTLITEVMQKVHFATSEFQLPRLGLVVTGDFLSIKFQFMREKQPVASVRKKVLAWGDCYEVEYYDSNLEQILLAAIMVIQMVIAAARRRRR